MKRLKFKKPFNGMDNAKKLIPESYKTDGNEFEMTDGNETYRVKWSSLINEGIILTSSNKARINEDMSKIKHLMGFKSQDTLGTVKGADRLDENKKFGNILNKSKNLLSEYHAEFDQDAHLEKKNGYDDGEDNSLNEKELTPAQKKEIDINNDGEIDAEDFKALRHNKEEDINEIENPDVQKFGDKLNDNAKLKALISKINTPAEKIEAGVEMSKMLADSDPSILKRIARAITKLAGDDTSDSSNPDETAGMGGIDEEINTELPPPPSEEEEQSAQIYEDRFNEMLEGMDEEEGVDEGNKIKPGTVRRGMGGERGLANSHLTPGESKGKPRNTASRRDGEKEIAHQLANMEPDEEALQDAAYEYEEAEIERELYNDSYKDRFDEVFEGMHEEEEGE